ncbi:hypothetical protein EUX98_g4917 [Antrodiella citrinella]|uniref:Aquaporin n=1 Tax=Antrodiella citrinella TaxID=2447956 RepID=A0A4S4MV82_9APHY|nr:hypothetical protein EUX98_g4917 [Antrodiella citrinella]
METPPSRSVHLEDISRRPALMVSWEKFRYRQAHWFVECVAEFMGVLIYTFAAVFQSGIAYGAGLALAFIVCASTSGGHFHPAVTISFVITKKFPPMKAVRYIASQILGSYVACLLVYVQYNGLIAQATKALEAAGTLNSVMFTPQGPAGIFAFYVLPGANLGQVFLNEFVCDFIFGMVIWAVIDPTNPFINTIITPWIFGLTLSLLIYGYSPIGVAINSSRDVGGRFAALTIWGPAAGGGTYAVLASLTNLPATFFGAMFYELMFTDSSRVVTASSLAVLAGQKALEQRRQDIRGVPSTLSGISYTVDLETNKTRGS